MGCLRPKYLFSEQKGRGGLFGGPAYPPKPSCPGEAHSPFKENKYGLKKPGDFIMSEGHRYPLVHNICLKFKN
jgi:hypothetical protein